MSLPALTAVILMLMTATETPELSQVNLTLPGRPKRCVTLSAMPCSNVAKRIWGSVWSELLPAINLQCICTSAPTDKSALAKIAQLPAGRDIVATVGVPGRKSMCLDPAMMRGDGAAALSELAKAGAPAITAAVQGGNGAGNYDGLGVLTDDPKDGRSFLLGRLRP